MVGANGRTSRPLATRPPPHATGMGTFHHPLDSPTRVAFSGQSYVPCDIQRCNISFNRKAGSCNANMHIIAYLTCCLHA